jgi:hypothetical protein
MVPGTPLIRQIERHSAAGLLMLTHHLVLFHMWHANDDIIVHVYDPSMKGVVPVTISQITTFDGSALKRSGVALYNWQEFIPPWMALTADWQIGIKPWRIDDPLRVYIYVRQSVENVITEYKKAHAR